MSEQPLVLIGDIWRDLDPRNERFVKVTDVRDLSVRIYSVERDSDGEWVGRKRSRETWANRDRFNGKRGGYTLHIRPAPPMP